MSQTCCERCNFLVPMRWLRPGDDLSRPDHIDQCAKRPLMRSERTLKCPLHAPDLAYVQTCRSHPASLTSTIEVGAGIKSP